MSSPSMLSPHDATMRDSISPPPLSPKIPSSEDLNQHEPSPDSPPAMLATMTPVNVMELQKDFEESQKNQEIYQERQIYYSDRPLSPGQIYQQHASPGDGYEEKQPQPQIDLIYEDGKQTVIYTTTADQKALEIYSQSGAGELVTPIDGSLMHTSDGTPVSVVVQGGLHYPQQTGATVLVLSELVEGMQHVER